MHKSWLLALSLFSLLALGSPATRGQDPPVDVDFFELEDHRVAGENSFRSPHARPRHEGTVFLNIVIDENGLVVAVAPNPDNSRGEIRRWYRRAADLARQWRFRPFVRAGRVVRARARAQVDVLPPVRWGRPRRFPVAPLVQYSVTLTRGGCFGTCPVYTVTVRGDGRVRFEGFADTAAKGVHESSVPVARVERLVARFRAANFWSLRRRYVADIPDAPAYQLTVTAGSRMKSVTDQEGREVGMPDIVRGLQDAVDEAADTARWIGADTAALVRR